MNKYLEKVIKYLKPIENIVKKYPGVVFLLFFSILAGYLVVRIGYLSRQEPTKSQIDQKLTEIGQTKIDSESLNKLKELEGRNISIEALFDNGRTNPFED